MTPPHRPAGPNTARTGRNDIPLFTGILLIVSAALALVLGFYMTGAGTWLIVLGGTFYYALAGIGFLVGGVLLLRREMGGLIALSLTALGTVLWALWEIHGKGWMQSWGFDLAGRVGLPMGILLVAFLVVALLRRRGAIDHQNHRWLLWPLAPVAILAIGVVVGVTQQEPQVRTRLADASTFASSPRAPTSAAGGRSALMRGDDEWTAYGGSNLGQRFSPAAQVTPDNVAGLEEVWRFETNDLPANDRVFYSFQNTPLKIDDSLYVCSNSNQVYALDPATGEQQWHFDPEISPDAMEPLFSVACRAVAYHEAPVQPEVAECPRRILLATQTAG